MDTEQLMVFSRNNPREEIIEEHVIYYLADEQSYNVQDINRIAREMEVWIPSIKSCIT